MKGCYVYFVDKDTENFIRSRIEGEVLAQPLPMAAEERGDYKTKS
jgi:hypothetical protein